MADIKDDEFISSEDAASALIAYVEVIANKLLSPETKISKAEKVAIDRALAELRPDLTTIRVLFSLLPLTPDKANSAFTALFRLMANLISVSTSAHHTPEAQEHFAKLRAAAMRDIKRKAPKEVALLAAIIAERGNGAAAQPKKEAGAILSDVNKRLRADGFEEVKIDVIRRRLQKFPAHS
jgi:hypothetical protein